MSASKGLSKDKIKVIAKFEAAFNSLLNGSGDPDKEDAAKDFASCFEHAYPNLEAFRRDAMDLQTRIEKLAVGCSPAPTLTRVPAVPDQPSGMSCILQPWQLGFQSQHSLKGPSKIVTIREIAMGFLETPFTSLENPISILMPFQSVVGSAVADFSVLHSVGFGKSCASKLILMCAARLALSDDDLRVVAKELYALLFLHCVYAPAESWSAEFTKALTAKMQAAERQRPDPLQILCAFANKAQAEGKELTPATVVDFIQDFENSTFTEGKKFTRNEVLAVKWMSTLSKSALAKIDYHWAQFRVSESALPLTRIATVMDSESRSVREATSDEFRSIYSSTDDKVEAFLHRTIGVFHNKLKQAANTVRSLACQRCRKWWQGCLLNCIRAPCGDLGTIKCPGPAGDLLRNFCVNKLA